MIDCALTACSGRVYGVFTVCSRRVHSVLEAVTEHTRPPHCAGGVLKTFVLHLRKWKAPYHSRSPLQFPLLTDIDFHSRPRLKSRRPICSNLPEEAQTIQHLWRTRWQNQIVDVPNTSLITVTLLSSYREWTCPGRGQLSLLNS